MGGNRGKEEPEKGGAGERTRRSGPEQSGDARRGGGGGPSQRGEEPVKWRRRHLSLPEGSTVNYRPEFVSSTKKNSLRASWKRSISGTSRDCHFKE